jgi:four helix bundle protein
MGRDVNALRERIHLFSVGIVKLVSAMRGPVVERHVGGQLLRSGTSVGANYEEACGAESRRDFIHKLRIALKEARESEHWLRILVDGTENPSPDAAALLKESRELGAILGKSIQTATANEQAQGQTPARKPPDP